MQNHWRKTLGYCSIFAAIPAILASHISEARSDEVKRTEASGVLQGAKRRQMLNKMLNKSLANPALLKRQSEFRLPHQKGNVDTLSTLAGTDDCPGRAIPGGSYSAAAPYTDSGDTTGANSTVAQVNYYYYYTFDAFGPDHVYSFTLTDRGQNPQIQVSTPSGTYAPLIYVLYGGYAGACPAGTGKPAYALTVGFAGTGGTATMNSHQMNILPLNVPLHLFVDSARNDASGSGPYTLRMQDVTISSSTCSNPIDCPEFFVHQHYWDFLSRESDAAGQEFWNTEITSCGTDAGCLETKRINVSAAFFVSVEFQETGYLVYRMYKSSYGNAPGGPALVSLNEFLPDNQEIGQGVVVNQSGWEQKLEINKLAFTARFVQRTRFKSAYPTSMIPAQFVDNLFANAGVTPSATDRAAAINEFGSATTTDSPSGRARALRRVADNSTLKQQEFNQAFVLMQYFGYLRRNPNDAPEPTLDFQGYNFWLNKLNQFNGDYVGAEMVKAFITSSEYRGRFGP